MFDHLSFKHFWVQLVLVFLLFTLGTVVGLGVPISLLLERHTTLQLHALADQSSQTTIALFNNKIAQLQNLAALISERPTLKELLQNVGDPQEIASYLEDILRNSGVDVMAVCEGGESIARSGYFVPMDICKAPNIDQIARLCGQAWCLADARIANLEDRDTRIIVGRRVNSVFAEFHSQTNLIYFLFENNERIASGELDEPYISLEEITPQIEQYQEFSLNEDHPRQVTHMAVQIPLEVPEDYSLIGLLNIETFLALNRQLRNIILITLFSLSLVGAGIAVLVARRIGKPLDQLAKSAAALREGDLTKPLTTSSDIIEIDQLTNALEDARISLKHSLDQLRMEKAWIENLMNSIVEGLLTIDDRALITYASEGIEQIVGLNVENLMGRLMEDIFITPHGEDSFLQQLPGPNQSRRIPILRDGREVLLAVSASSFVPPEAGNATRALVIRDVSDEERIHRLIGEFMANITHEFRTPLAALSASVELLSDQLPSLTTPEIEGLLHSLNIGIINLQSLIDNLIEAASIEAGRFKVNPQKVDFDSILQEAVHTIQPIAEKHGLMVILPPKKLGFLVQADKRRTSQVLVNLLSNAIKHSPEAGKITIRTVILSKQVQVEIQDEGEGISDQRKPQLFNRFVAASPEDHTSQLGLGLSVVKAIIEAQNGKVGYRDGETGGAIFWFTLPLVTKEAQ
jgi:PAS domain S-box-containing protein